MKSGARHWCIGGGLLACLVGCVDPKQRGSGRDAVVEEIEADGAVGPATEDGAALDQSTSSLADAPLMPDGALFLDAAIDLAPTGRVTGLACTQGAQCLSGFCADGVCCASEC